MNNPITLDMIRPSGSHEWFYCHGSHAMQQGRTNDEDEVTKQGTAVHWVGAEILRPYTVFSSELKHSGDFIGKTAPNGVFIDDEMYQGAMLYVREILNYCNSTGLISYVQVEELLQIGVIYPGYRGTPDAWVYNAAKAELVIWDLKFGFGHVEEYENPQFINYIAGILDLLKIDGHADQYLTIRMIIVQPRSYHSSGGPVREWVVKASDLRPYFNKMRHAAEQAMSGNGLCTPGLHCRHCLARNDCTAITKTLYNYIDVITGPERSDLQGESLVLEWKLLSRMEKLLKYRKSAIDGQIEASIQEGEKLPGVLLELLFHRETWKKDVPVEKLLAIGKMYGADISKPANLDTPNQAMTKIKKAAKQAKLKVDKQELLGKWIVQPFKGYKIVEDDGVEVNKVFQKPTK